MRLEARVGDALSADGVPEPLRLGRQNDLIVSQLHGRYYELAVREYLFTGGMVGTSISNVTFTVATPGVTGTPIIGLWNPQGSGVNAVLLLAMMNAYKTALQNTGPGGFTWMATHNAGQITTGITPFSTKTLQTGGAKCKVFAGTAMTAKATDLVLLRGSAMGGGSSAGAAFLETQVGSTSMNPGAVENIDGSIIVPPNGFVGLFANVTPVGHSATSGLLFAEVPA